MNAVIQHTQTLQEQFAEMLEQAKQLYPNIEESMTTLSNITAETKSLQDFLNLTYQEPSEVSNNHVTPI